MTDAFGVIEPQRQNVLYRGELLEIRPITIGQLPQLLRTAKPVIDAVMAFDDLPKLLRTAATSETDTAAGELAEGGELAGANDSGLIDLVMTLIADHGEKLHSAAALITGQQEGWIAGGDLAEFVNLVIAVFEVNRDFFAQMLAPLLAGRAKGETIGAGEIRYNS